MSRTNDVRVVHKQESHPSYKGVRQIMFIYQPHVISNSISSNLLKKHSRVLKSTNKLYSKGGKGVGCDLICSMNISLVKDLVEI